VVFQSSLQLGDLFSWYDLKNFCNNSDTSVVLLYERITFEGRNDDTVLETLGDLFELTKSVVYLAEPNFENWATELEVFR